VLQIIDIILMAGFLVAALCFDGRRLRYPAIVRVVADPGDMIIVAAFVLTGIVFISDEASSLTRSAIFLPLLVVYRFLRTPREGASSPGV
jgi:hypothetical protein